jgi:uncharacterized protein (TIGR02284 family)
MENYTATESTKLKDLIEKIHDGEKGFKKASEHTNHPFLKGYFEKKSIEKFDFANELRTEIRMYGIQDDTSGSIAGAVHRTWMDFKDLFSFDDDEAILEQTITGEKAAVAEYNAILDGSSLPLRTRAILLKQKEIIEKDLRTIKKLEDLKD